MEHLYIAGRSKEELADAIAAGVQPGSVMYGTYVAGLAVRSVQDLERVGAAVSAAIGEAAAASDRLGRRIFWLNVVLAVATVVGAVATAWAAFT